MIIEDKLKIAANPESLLALASVLMKDCTNSLSLLQRLDNFDGDETVSERDKVGVCAKDCT